MRKQFVGASLILLLYIIWFVVLAQWRSISLAPLVLVLSTFIVGWYHTTRDIPSALFFGITAVGGFTLSCIGTHTGVLFGQYFYGQNLGFSVFETPLSIGLLWLLLCYCSSCVVASLGNKLPLFNNAIVRVLSASCIIFVLILLLENIAAPADFWYFKNQQAPLQNYTAWFVFTVSFNFLFVRLNIPHTNPVAKWWLTGLGLFLLAINLLSLFVLG